MTHLALHLHCECRYLPFKTNEALTVGHLGYLPRESVGIWDANMYDDLGNDARAILTRFCPSLLFHNNPVFLVFFDALDIFFFNRCLRSLNNWAIDDSNNPQRVVVCPPVSSGSPHFGLTLINVLRQVYVSESVVTITE